MGQITRSTHARIADNLNQPKASDLVVPIGSLGRENERQEKLNDIANQATNLGFGCGVGLRKAMDNTKTFCEKLKGHFYDTRSGFFDMLFSSNKLHTTLTQVTNDNQNAKVVQNCFQQVAQMENDLIDCAPERANRY